MTQRAAVVASREGVPPNCPRCSSSSDLTGQAGTRRWYRCVACRMVFWDSTREYDREDEVAADVGAVVSTGFFDEKDRIPHDDITLAWARLVAEMMRREEAGS